MELKEYQAKVLADLDAFLFLYAHKWNAEAAYDQLWKQKAINPPRPWNATLGATPIVCTKVPTAGGKTFLGVNAIASIFNTLPDDQRKVVVWLVPSVTILDQTVKNFRNTLHEYRIKLNQLFQNRVEIYDKEQLLSGASFAQSATESILNILILSYDSFRTRSKDGRLVYRENGALAELADLLPKGNPIQDADPTSLASVLNSLHPVVVIDESHNANSELSIDMLKVFNPSFVLELTATPRDRSNLISIVDSLALKKESMVKLPTIACNNSNTTEVILNAITLRNNLEKVARIAQDRGAPYVRPIVLFQAQPASRDVENETFDKLKQKLINCQIPENQIAIKTANNNTIKNIDLLSKKCPIRYIITINALKEGWDCPFAYILATVANRSSPIEVEQIVGRILRQPYQRRFENSLLNISYVLTSSDNFLQTVERIIGALQFSGFSRSDFRIANIVDPAIEEVPPPATPPNLQPQPAPANGVTQPADIEDIDSKHVAEKTADDNNSADLQNWQDLAAKAEQNINEDLKKQGDPMPVGSGGRSNFKKMEPVYSEKVRQIKLPQFYMKVEIPDFFSEPAELGQTYQKVDIQTLMDGFKLSQQNTQIDFDAAPLDMYQIDIDDSTFEHAVKLNKVDQRSMEKFATLLSHLSKPQQIKEIAVKIVNQVATTKWLPSKDLEQYVLRVLEGLDHNLQTKMAQDPSRFALKIREKIDSLAQEHAHEQFKTGIQTGNIICRAEWAFPESIEVSDRKGGIRKCLYSEEQSMNSLELDIINGIANLENVLCWHRIIVRRDYHINGWWGNHYPDFVVITKRNNIILVETKGGDRDNSDTKKKIELGSYWQQASSESVRDRKWRYFCVFDQDPMERALDKRQLLNVVGEL